MSEDVKLEVIRSTQDSLSKYITKPKLTEKLLRKPPFRYLHDITVSVMKETGYLQGLFSPDELNPENVKDRDAKIAFLDKLIAAVNLSTGVNITARPNKIVAGLDVAKTNELLQTIGKALEKKVDSSEAVELVLNKKIKIAKETSKTKMTKETKANDLKSREPRTSEVLKKKNKEKAKPVENSKSKKSNNKKEISPSQPSDATMKGKLKVQDLSDMKDESEQSMERVEQPQSAEEQSMERVERPQSARRKPVDVGSTTQEGIKTEDLHVYKSENIENKSPGSHENSRQAEEDRLLAQTENNSSSQAEEDRLIVQTENNSSRQAEEDRLLAESEAKPSSQNEEEKPITRAQSVRRERPRTAARPVSARPGAPRLREHLTDNDNKVTVTQPVNLIIDTQDLVEDEHTVVTVDNAVADSVSDQVVDEPEQGHLVSQILETQKELEDSTSLVEAAQRVDISWTSGRGRESVVREIDKLQSCIQAMTRAANPLGKLIDFLQEDVDAMQAELESWVATNHQLNKDLHSEERLTEESVEPLVRQLEEVEQLTDEQLEEISAVKAAILRNDERIVKLLKSGPG